MLDCLFNKITSLGKNEVERNNGILSEIDRGHISELMAAWSYCFYKIETFYIKGQRPFSDDVDIAYSLIGESFCYLNEINSLITARLKYYKDMVEDQQDSGSVNGDLQSKEFEYLIRYFKFFNNLLASKIKCFFFREVPILSSNHPFFNVDKDFSDVAYELVDVLMCKNIAYEKIRYLIANYCLLQEMMYAFVYHPYEWKGVFLRFKFDKMAFRELKQRIESHLLLSIEEHNIKYFLSEIGSLMFGYYLQRYKGLGYEYTDDSIQKPACYEDFYELSLSTKGVFVEPLIYQLYDILWKLYGMVSVTDKPIEKEKYELKKNRLSNELRYFIEKYLEDADLMYKKGQVSFAKLYDMGRRIFSGIDGECEYRDDIKGPVLSLLEREKKGGIYFQILKDPKVAEVYDRLYKMRSLMGNIKPLPFKDVDANVDVSKQKDVVLQKLNSLSEGDFKVETLLVDFNAQEIVYVLGAFADMLKSQMQNCDKKCSIVGFYKSGVFLGHILNIFNNRRDDVWQFSVKPYVATHPIHTDNKNDRDKRIILIDDSIKTGFTYSLYRTYIKRNKCDHNYNIHLYSLFNYNYFTRLQGISRVDYMSLFDIFGPRQSVTLNSRISYYSDVITEVKYKNINIEDFVMAVCSDGEVDLSYLLANTDVLLSISFKFIKDINEGKKVLKRDRIVLYSPSTNGYVILMMCAFICKVVYGHDIIIAGPFFEKDESRDLLVAIDISMISGFSLMYNWKVMTKGRYVKGDNEESCIEGEFDLVLSVYGASKYKSIKFKNLI
jgi:hypothetical protein